MVTESERIAVLETKVDALIIEIRSLKKEVGEVHDIFNQARGARWAIIITAGIVGFVSAKVLPLLTAMGFR